MDCLKQRNLIWQELGGRSSRTEPSASGPIPNSRSLKAADASDFATTYLASSRSLANGRPGYLTLDRLKLSPRCAHWLLRCKLEISPWRNVVASDRVVLHWPNCNVCSDRNAKKPRSYTDGTYQMSHIPNDRIN